MINEKDFKQVMSNIGVQLMNNIQMGISYSEHWSKEFSYKEILENHKAILDNLKEVIGDITSFSKDELLQLGFKQWSEEMPTLLLVPIWIYPLIPDGTQFISIHENKVTKGKDNIDLDVHFGCIAYGIEVVN